MTAPVARTVQRHADGRRLYLYGRVGGTLPISGGAAPTGPSALHRRWDPLNAEWVAISPARNARPESGADMSCPLCPGGPEVPFDYDAAVVENRFPTLAEAPPAVAAAGPGAVTRVAPSRGRCEVVLYTSAHTGSLATLPPEVVARVVAVWRDRSADLWTDPAHVHVQVFENRGEAVGATISHPHGQIYAYPHLPPLVAGRAAPWRPTGARTAPA